MNEIVTFENMTIKKGSKVILSTCWGLGKKIEAVVESFGEKNDMPLFEYTSNDPKTGGWAYMYQLEEVIEF